MRFAHPNCPECGQSAKGTLETMSGCAQLIFGEDGEADYDGYTEVYWDDQRTDTDEAGHVWMICPDGHEWTSECDDSMASSANVMDYKNNEENDDGKGTMGQ